MVTAIAIDVQVIVIPIGIGAAATINAAIRTRCRCRHVWAPIDGVLVKDDAIVAGAPAAPPLLPSSGATDPTAAALTKTRNGVAAATATATAATATATEEEECDGCDPPGRRNPPPLDRRGEWPEWSKRTAPPCKPCSYPQAQKT